MGDSTIPLIDLRTAALPLPSTPAPASASGLLSDQRGRPLRDLRISVTDRCNFRCSYCMPKEVFDKHYPFLPQSSLLTFEEITRLARLFVAQGVEKIRLTGGEPLLRKHLEVLIEMLAALKTPGGRFLDLTLTTNASLLARKASSLAQAGLRRITISLDALDDPVFRAMNDVDFPVIDVLRGIDAAVQAGLGPVKVNMVVKRGVNDQEILPMARHFRNHYGGAVALRFIEYMDVGSTNGWQMAHVLPSDEVRRRLNDEFPLVRQAPTAIGETAERWAYADGKGEVGFISSVSHAFCGDCNRARLSTEGRLYLCLFAHQGYDFRSPLRAGVTDEQLLASIAATWGQRADRYSELRAAGTPPDTAGRRVEMHYIGG